MQEQPGIFSAQIVSQDVLSLSTTILDVHVPQQSHDVLKQEFGIVDSRYWNLRSLLIGPQEIEDA
jgi:hypothetical protein